MSENSNIIEKIKRLLALAGNNPNQHESAMAAAKVAELMDKYNIDMADVIAEDLLKNKDAVTDETINEWAYATSIPSWLQILCSGMAKIFDCHVKISRGMDGKLRIRVFGYKPDVAVTKYMVAYLIGQINRLSAEAWDKYQYTKYTRGVSQISWKRKYQYGLVVGIIDEVKKIYKKDESSTSTALVLKKDKAIIEKYGEFNYNNHKEDFNAAHMIGLNDANKVKIRKAIDNVANGDATKYLK